MTLLDSALILATYLCSLVAGLLLAFALVIMPGLRTLNSRDFIRAFQVIDRVIQNNQPLFLFVWVGSVLALAAAAVLAFWELRGAGRIVTILAAILYIAGVQLPTIVVNLPLNNALQAVDVDAISEAGRQRARDDFEAVWNRWNVVRTACAALTSLLLIVLLFRI